MTLTNIDHSTALKNLSMAYERNGDFRNAALTMRTQMRLWRDSHDIANVQRIVTLYFRAGMVDKAWRVLHWYEASVAKPNDILPAEFENLAGAILMRLGKYDLAEGRFRTALQKNPSLESARRNLNGLLQESKESHSTTAR